VDARDQLRRYLEQRREMGESELVLDGMSVDEALAMLGAVGGVGVPRDASRAKRERGAPAPQVAQPDSGEPVSTEPTPFPAREISEPQIGGDWREALRATGAAPDAMAKKKSSSAPAAASLSPAGAPTGIGAEPIGTSDDSPAVLHASLPELHTLDEVVAHIASCTRCPLYSTALNPVPGEGNPNADFMCVGEAPGATEDETGRPFIGAAGQLLTKILAAIGLSRDDVYIVNVLKHRPPGNRNPQPNEVAACSPYLIRQIELIQPKVILALGTFAAQTLLNSKTPIGKLRGQVHEYHGVPVIVTYHPAALLRNPSWKRPTWEDVQLAHRILNSAPEPGA
jgi:uracil-DNA glycosylase